MFNYNSYSQVSLLKKASLSPIKILLEGHCTKENLDEANNRPQKNNNSLRLEYIEFANTLKKLCYPTYEINKESATNITGTAVKTI